MVFSMDQLTSFTWVNFLICFSPRSNLWVIFITYRNHSTFTHHHFALSLGDHMFLSAKSFQSRPTLSDPIDCSLPGSPVHGILQARTLEWIVISFSIDKAWSEWSEVAQLCPTLCDPMNCSLPGSSIHGIFQARIQFPSAGRLPDPGIEPGSPAL